MKRPVMLQVLRILNLQFCDKCEPNIMQYRVYDTNIHSRTYRDMNTDGDQCMPGVSDPDVENSEEAPKTWFPRVHIHRIRRYVHKRAYPGQSPPVLNCICLQPAVGTI